MVVKLLDLLKIGASEINPSGKNGTGGRYASSVRVPGLSVDREGQSALLSNQHISSPPGFYSPFLTSTAFQVPNNRKEMYQWAAMWYDNDPKVAAGINFYTDFIFSGFTLECESAFVSDYFDQLVKKLNFSKWLPMISFEYHLRGDVFPFLTIDCPECSGTNINQNTGEGCKHDGATWRSISLVDPNQIEVTPSLVDQEPAIYFIPNEQMIRIVQSGQPKEQFDAIPNHFKQLIAQKQPIYLDPNCVFHFKRAASAWSPYGTSLVRSLFPVLMFKDKLRQAQNTIADRLILPIKVVKVGDADRPANDEDIRDVQEQLAARAVDPYLTIVTHHAFQMEFVQPSALAGATSEHENIEKDLLDGLMLSSQIISGEGPAYAGMIGAMSLDRRLEKFRLEVAQWIEEKIFKPVAIWNGFTMSNSQGSEEVIYPTIKWNDLQLRDETSRLNTLQAMQQAGIISAQTMIEALGLNYDQEVERLRFEQSSTLGQGGGIPLGGAAMGGAMGGGFGGGMGDLGLGGGMPGMPPMGGEDLGGLPPEMGGAPMPGAPPAGGGAPPVPPVPATASNKAENYKKSSDVIYRMITAAKSSSVVSEPHKFKSQLHKEFYQTLLPVSGRAFAGGLDKSFKTSDDNPLVYPKDGGVSCSPLNHLASAQLYYYLKSNPRTATAKKKPAKDQEDMLQPRLFTKLEQGLYDIILSLNIPIPLYAQLMAGPSQEYTLDAAFPSIRLGIEADSEAFHASSEQIKRDKYRDSVLATDGWTILRFTDKEIKDKSSQVGQLITNIVHQLMSNNSNLV